jgi:F-box domain
MTHALSLDRLPIETLRRIAGCLPPISALNFLLVCRNINKACNDWTVWRDVVKASLDFSVFESHADEMMAKERWKRFAIAMMKADQGRHDDHVAALLPQMMALHRRLFTASYIGLLLANCAS